ncbi:uncharacterized acetyltransferase At3g50280-like [Trifolium pratense]|uniref:uncharacterized acetyltransferase At3g50280-like n=1 Tax=Trifolium pratense TaxID=57577 RepID=UPI001E690B3F|nr:uncharacterized acetyltransferase At3g50280-like [Trifolium pratense]
MTGIRLISTTTIQATKHDENNSTHKKIDLTPWDLTLLKIETIQQGLLFHKPKTNQIQHLKQTLSTTLNFFPPLTGRLVITRHDEHNKASCSVICNNVGALFVHAIAENTTIADITQPNYVPPIVHALFPLNGVKNYEGTTQPVLAVQVTELIDGIFIGFAINHLVADGKSFWLFVNSWAEISRGFNKPTKIPTFERWFPDDINRPIQFPFTEDAQKKQREIPPIRLFHFTKEKVAQLKSKANAEIGHSSTNNTDKIIIISSFQALITHIWRSSASKQHAEPGEETSFALVMDCRTRMCPNLGENYFGNTRVFEIVTMKTKELMEGGIGKVSMEINKVISTQSHEKIMNQYESWLKTPIIIVPGMLSRSNVLMANSSPRFDVYGNDFGWGKPIAVRNGVGNKSIGKVTVFAGFEQGSIDVELCLPYDVLEALGNDQLFLDAMSV